MKRHACWRTVVFAAWVAIFVGCAQTKIQQRVAKLTGVSKVGESKKAGPKFESELSMARLRERHGETDAAAAIYAKVIEIDPNNVLAHHRLGVISAADGRFEKADAHFQTALQIAPPTTELLNDIGYSLYLRDELSAAEVQLRKAVELDPRNSAARTNLGLVLGEQRRFEESLTHFRKATGNEGEAHANLAYVYSLLGDLEKAQEEYHIALAKKPDLRPAGEALLQLAGNERALTAARVAETKARQRADRQQLPAEGHQVVHADATQHPRTHETANIPQANVPVAGMPDATPQQFQTQNAAYAAARRNSATGGQRSQVRTASATESATAPPTVRQASRIPIAPPTQPAQAQAQGQGQGQSPADHRANGGVHTHFSDSQSGDDSGQTKVLRPNHGWMQPPTANHHPIQQRTPWMQEQSYQR